MIRSTLSGAALMLVLGTPVAVADPLEDARVIVGSTFTEAYFEASLEQLTEMLVGFMQNEFRKNGTELSKDASEVLTGMMVASMVDGMAEGMWEPMAQAYVENFTPETLAAYRAFLETDAGREVSAKQGIIVSESGRIGEAVGATLGLRAAEDIRKTIEAGEWPNGTLASTKKELTKAFQ